MPPRRSSARCSSAAAGFTLVELLVALTMASIVIFGVGTGYVFVTKAWVEHQARAQAQQSLRAAETAMSRELRISGACVGVTWVDQNAPLASNFRMLTGTSGPPDTITTVANPRCAGPVKLTQACTACTTMYVDTTLNFTAGMWAFIGKGIATEAGEYFLVQSIDPTNNTVTASAAVTGTYPAATDTTPSFVAGADRRTFAVSSSCTGCNGIPTLTLQQLGDSQGQPLVKGVESMTVRYVVNRRYADNPSACNAQTGGTNSLCVVNLPEASPSLAGDWRLVRAVILTLGTRSILPVRGNPDAFYHLSETTEISPRNFIFSPNGARVPWQP